MKLGSRSHVGTRAVALMLAAFLIASASGCGESKPTVAPADQTSVNANQANSSAWQKEKVEQKNVKKK